MSWTSSQWKAGWSVLKDIGLTGLGMYCIYSQIASQHPSGLVLGAGLALTVPSVAEHVKALLPSSEASSSSHSSPPPGSSSPALPPTGTGSGGGNGAVAAKSP